MPPISSGKACNSSSKASEDLEETFLESLLVVREGPLEEALDQAWVHFLELLGEPEEEGPPMEAVEPQIPSSKARYHNHTKA